MGSTYLIMKGSYSDRTVITTTSDENVARKIVERNNEYANYSDKWYYEEKPSIDSKAIEEVYVVTFGYIKDAYHYVAVKKDIRFEAEQWKHEVEGDCFSGWKGTLYFIEEVVEGTDPDRFKAVIEAKYDVLLADDIKRMLDGIFDDNKQAYELTKELQERMERETGEKVKTLDLF